MFNYLKVISLKNRCALWIVESDIEGSLSNGSDVIRDYDGHSLRFVNKCLANYSIRMPSMTRAATTLSFVCGEFSPISYYYINWYRSDIIVGVFSIRQDVGPY